MRSLPFPSPSSARGCSQLSVPYPDSFNKTYATFEPAEAVEQMVGISALESVWRLNRNVAITITTKIAAVMIRILRSPTLSCMGIEASPVRGAFAGKRRHWLGPFRTRRAPADLSGNARQVAFHCRRGASTNTRAECGHCRDARRLALRGTKCRSNKSDGRLRATLRGWQRRA